MLIWVEINKEALQHNIRELRRLLAPSTLLTVVVKSNAYGHGLVEASRAFAEAGADWLAVHSLIEAQILRDAGITTPIYILGYVQLEELERAIDLDCRIVVYNNETIAKLGELGKPVNVHIKVETGTHRQGVLNSELPAFVDLIKQYENITIEGVSTHFANIEDTENDAYFQEQLGEFQEGVKILEEKGIDVPIKHCAAAAAVLLFKQAHFDMVRIGISAYGMWPSEKTRKSYEEMTPENPITLRSAFAWKSRLAQIKKIGKGRAVGYGCTYVTDKETVMAVIPVGYYDGYVRAVGGKAYVLVHGKRAPVLGRVSMNNIVVDITEIPLARLEDGVVLLGTQGEETISAELFAAWADTINYEITTRIPAGINTNIPRIMI